jgi:hypothetical protein
MSDIGYLINQNDINKLGKFQCEYSSSKCKNHGEYTIITGNTVVIVLCNKHLLELYDTIGNTVMKRI